MSRAKISSQLVIGVGLSNGWEEFALKKPPPLLPSSLIHSCEATGPMAMVCWAPWSVVMVRDGSHVCGNALPDEHERPDDRDRQQDVQDPAREVHPVVAERLGAASREPAEQGDRDREAGGRGGEVADGQHRGLGQVGRAGLTGVVLPVGVGLEAHRRVEGEVRAHRRDPALVEGQDVLQPQHHVAGDDRDGGHREHGDGVTLPRLLGGLVHPDDAVDDPLDRADDRAQEDPLPLHDAVDVPAEEGDDEDDRDRQRGEREEVVDGHAQKSSGRSSAHSR